jgi:hypothetical protein
MRRIKQILSYLCLCHRRIFGIRKFHWEEALFSKAASRSSNVGWE